jgi:RNA polymerase primary sigma factor
MQCLSDGDRKTLQQLLARLAECVYDPSFRSTTLPGLAAPGVPRLVAPEDAEGAEPTTVLTAAEERALFRRFNYCRYRVMRVLYRYRGGRLDAEGARELLHWHGLAQEARAEIIRHNTPLVLAMARRWRGNGVELSERVCEGNLTLLRCVDKFSAARGFKFSTYACRAILASFARLAAKAARYRTRCPTRYDPAMDRSNHLELKREGVALECVDELKRILCANAAHLNAIERRVLTARFDLGSRRPQGATEDAPRPTLDQVGALLGVSKERVRQIQNQAVRKLRAALERRLLAAS